LRQLYDISHCSNPHPNINQFYGITCDPEANKFMLILQFANRGNLRQYLNNKWHEGIYKISINKIIKFAKQVTDGLEYLHKNNIIHCDLHPKNILMNDDKLLIADFGLSRKLDDSYISSASILKGVPAYLDPYCHHRPGKQLDEKSDIYSLGVIFWELTSGIRPFANAEHGWMIISYILAGYREQTIPGTPPKYAKLYQKCWSFEPTKRPMICEILENLDLISEEKVDQFIMNDNRELIPIETDEQHKNMHNDDYAKILLHAHSPSKSNPKTSIGSSAKASSAISVKKSKESFHSNSKNSKDSSSTRSLKMYFSRQKLENADEMKSQGKKHFHDAKVKYPK
ncbi:1302_t:CDS:2, partial [Racocetra persica]